jgi:hypothetical protein
MLFNIFQLLNEHSEHQQTVTLNWIYDEDDDTIKDFGEDIAQEFPSIDFIAVTISAA